jgi:hypothetical protein
VCALRDSDNPRCQSPHDGGSTRGQTRRYAFCHHRTITACSGLANGPSAAESEHLLPPMRLPLFRPSDHTSWRKRRCTASGRCKVPMRLESFCMLRQWTFGQAIPPSLSLSPMCVCRYPHKPYPDSIRRFLLPHASFFRFLGHLLLCCALLCFAVLPLSPPLSLLHLHVTQTFLPTNTLDIGRQPPPVQALRKGNVDPALCLNSNFVVCLACFIPPLSALRLASTVLPLHCYPPKYQRHLR